MLIYFRQPVNFNKMPFMTFSSVRLYKSIANSNSKWKRNSNCNCKCVCGVRYLHDPANHRHYARRINTHLIFRVFFYHTISQLTIECFCNIFPSIDYASVLHILYQILTSVLTNLMWNCSRKLYAVVLLSSKTHCYKITALPKLNISWNCLIFEMRENFERETLATLVKTKATYRTLPLCVWNKTIVWCSHFVVRTCSSFVHVLFFFFFFFFVPRFNSMYLCSSRQIVLVTLLTFGLK